MQYFFDRDENSHKFTFAKKLKDIRYVNAMATEEGVMNVMASAARHYFTHAEAMGEGANFVPMLSDHVAKLNGMDLAAEVAKNKQ